MSYARFDVDGRMLEERPMTVAEEAERYGLALPPAKAVERPDKPWLVVHRTARSDRHALDWLRRLGLQCYYPMMRQMRPVPKRMLSRGQRLSGLDVKRPCAIPLFPGYIFVRIDIARDDWARVREVANVGGMACAGNLPVEISERLITTIRGCEVDGLVPGKTPAALIFRRGEVVRIGDGALEGLLATIEQTPDYAIEDVDGQTRIRVAVGLFGVPTPVDLALWQIEKL